MTVCRCDAARCDVRARCDTCAAHKHEAQKAKWRKNCTWYLDWNPRNGFKPCATESSLQTANIRIKRVKTLLTLLCPLQLLCDPECCSQQREQHMLRFVHRARTPPAFLWGNFKNSSIFSKQNTFCNSSLKCPKRCCGSYLMWATENEQLRVEEHECFMFNIDMTYSFVCSSCSAADMSNMFKINLHKHNNVKHIRFDLKQFDVGLKSFL